MPKAPGLTSVWSPEPPSMALRPLLEECGYGGSRLATNYNLNGVSIPIVGFVGKPWDIDSACIAVVDDKGDPEQAARSCYDLAAPVVWVRRDKSVDWWIQRPIAPKLFQSRSVSDFPALVRQYRAQLEPTSIYRGKTIARIDQSRQLDFVDIGLMPLRREEAGKKLGDIVEDMTRSILKALRRRDPSKELLHAVFTSVFRLLGGKILKDKAVRGFVGLDLADPESVLTAVANHYDTSGKASRVPSGLSEALKAAALLLHAASSFSVVSPETLAYVYEHTLVTKPLRTKLGIHATPPWLVDYIVWTLADWILDIPLPDRHVFEPACGHAPFLLSAMRLLRLDLQNESDGKIHAYLKAHIHGIEIDPFAREIARLSLTLADIPNPNSWDLKDGDMYASNVLAVEAAKCRVLLSNPPFQRFTPTEKMRYTASGFPVHHKKAAELLSRTLKHLSPGSVFGVVVPQGVLHNTGAKAVRDFLLKECEVRELCLFADKVFDRGDAETVVILGRRRQAGVSEPTQTTVRRVREDSISRFAKSYFPDAEQIVPQERLGTDKQRIMRLPDLPEVWNCLSWKTVVGSVADVGQGLSFAEKGLIEKARELGSRKTADAIPAFLTGVGSLAIWETPRSDWLSAAGTPIAAWRSGQHTGKPQVLVNYSPVSRGPWRIKALLDNRGHAVTNTFTTVRPHPDGPSVTFLWAILNSPLANGYVYCNALKRHIYDSLIESLPLPLGWREHLPSIEAAATAYLRLVRDGPDKFELQNENDSAVCDALLAMDAAVMRAYDLPPRLERALLDVFRTGQKKRHRRKGVGCVFGDYFPAELGSFIPLWLFLSDEYQRSTPEDILANSPIISDPDLLEALRSAE